MKKYWLINVEGKFKKSTKFRFQKDDVIIYEMPPFCSGDYIAKVHYDNTLKHTYIYENDNFFNGCRDFSVKRNGKYVKIC